MHRDPNNKGLSVSEKPLSKKFNPFWMPRIVVRGRLIMSGITVLFRDDNNRKS